MSKSKTHKALVKRFKVTRTGKVLRRPIGQDHFLAKQTGKKRRNKRRYVELSEVESKVVKKLLR